MSGSVPSGEKVQVVVRMDKDLVKQLDHMAVEMESYRGEAMERLLRLATALMERIGASVPDWDVMSAETFERVMRAARELFAQQALNLEGAT